MVKMDIIHNVLSLPGCSQFLQFWLYRYLQMPLLSQPKLVPILHNDHTWKFKTMIGIQFSELLVSNWGVSILSGYVWSINMPKIDPSLPIWFVVIIECNQKLSNWQWWIKTPFCWEIIKKTYKSEVVSVLMFIIFKAF